MTDKELRRLKRTELLEMLVAQIKENDELRKQLEEKEEELKNRQIMIRESGTMAEAALKLNKVFEAADEAARQYLENIIEIHRREEAGTSDPIEAEEAPEAEQIEAAEESTEAEQTEASEESTEEEETSDTMQESGEETENLKQEG